MINRYKIPKNTQIKYFQEVEQISGLGQNKLASLLGIVPRSYRDWRRGKFAPTERAIKIINKQFSLPFPYSEEKALFLWKQNKLKAAHDGGLARIKQYGEIGTPEGRSKGGRRGLARLKELGLIREPKPFIYPSTYSNKLAEFVGILLGDGHVGKEQWSISLNSLKDKDYTKFVTNMVKDLFGFYPTVHTRSDSHVIVISGSGVSSIKYFVKIGLKIGNKVKQQVGVPAWITDNALYSRFCLMGLMDTDGGIFKHKYSVNGKKYTYIKLCFSNRSMPLLQFVKNTLKNSDLTPKLIANIENKKVWLYNQTEVTRYIELIGTHNPRLLMNLGGVR